MPSDVSLIFFSFPFFSFVFLSFLRAFLPQVFSKNQVATRVKLRYAAKPIQSDRAISGRERGKSTRELQQETRGKCESVSAPARNHHHRVTYGEGRSR